MAGCWLYIDTYQELKKILWSCFGCRFLLQVGHFFCTFTACRRQVSQKTCLQDSHLSQKIGVRSPSSWFVLFMSSLWQEATRHFGDLIAHPQGPQHILSSMSWKQMPHFAEGRLTGESGRFRLTAFLLGAVFLGLDAPKTARSSSGVEVRSTIASCPCMWYQYSSVRGKSPEQRDFPASIRGAA